MKKNLNVKCENNKITWQFLDDDERMEIEIDPQEHKEFLGKVDWKRKYKTLFAIYKKQ